MFIELARGGSPTGYLTAGAPALDRLLLANFTPVTTARNPVVPHAVYAALWERTGVLGIVREAVDALLGGPDAGRLSVPGLAQAETTASLLLRDPLPGSVLHVTTSLRPDPDAVRDALYQRLFGSLVGPADPELPANESFLRLFGEFVARGSDGGANRNNRSGTNPTRNGEIARIARRLREGLQAARPAGVAMSRDEYVSLAYMGWLELTFAGNSPLLVDVGATGKTPAERIQRLTSVMGLGTSELDPLLEDLIDLTRPMALLLNLIERGLLEPPGGRPAWVYTNGTVRAALETVAGIWPDAVVAPLAHPMLDGGPERRQLRIAS